MDFLIFYEHINREIENVTLVKKELEKRGYSCDVVKFCGPGLYKYHKRKNKAKVVITPWLRDNFNVAIYLPYSKKPYKIANLQWEQIYNSNDLKSGIAEIFDEAKIAYHMCWGENSRARLEGRGVLADNLSIVGAIQQDYDRALLRDYYLPRDEIAKKFNLDNDKKWVLYISSFGWANYSEPSLKLLANQYGDYIIKNARMHRESQIKTLEWIEELLKKSTNVFIYRPHPSENTAEELFVLERKYPHFRVISDLSVKQWAKVSDKVNLWISTSNAELASLGVDYNIVRPIKIAEDYEVESMRDEEFVTDLDAFISLNSDFSEDSKERISKRLEALSYFYDYDENRAAYERIADYLEEVYKAERCQKFRFSLRQRIKFKIHNTKKIIISWYVERQLKYPNKRIIERSFFKKEIKENMKKMISNYNAMQVTQKRMSDYIDSHG